MTDMIEINLQSIAVEAGSLTNRATCLIAF